MFPLSRRRTLVAGAALAVVGTIVAIPQAAAAPAAHYSFGGSAFGTSVKLGTVVQSGSTSLVTMCTTKNSNRDNSAASTGLGAAGKIGAVTTSIKGSDASGIAQTVTTTKTGAVSLLGGLVTADAITTQATVNHTSAGYTTVGSTKIADLKIAGVKVSATPAKNTTIALPAKLGSVTLNKQATASSMGRHQIVVGALSINLNDASLLGLPSGSIRVGYANALLHDPVHIRPSGYAYATQINVADGAVKSGPTAVTTLPCGGTTGTTLHNDTGRVSVPGIATVAAAGTTGVSTDNSSATSAKTSATTGAVSLLGGVVELDAITVKASAVQKPGQKVSLSSAGTKVAQLKINGKPVTVNVKENTKINIAGIGTLWLDKTIRSSTQIQVYGVQLELLKAKAGLKAGAVVSVGYARTAVSPS